MEGLGVRPHLKVAQHQMALTMGYAPDTLLELKATIPHLKTRQYTPCLDACGFKRRARATGGKSDPSFIYSGLLLRCWGFSFLLLIDEGRVCPGSLGGSSESPRCPQFAQRQVMSHCRMAAAWTSNVCNTTASWAPFLGLGKQSRYSWGRDATDSLRRQAYPKEIFQKVVELLAPAGALWSKLLGSQLVV